ncbi:MAG TPA: phosphatidylglycerophosphatase A [Xanthomonadales bacterium]|nr:phosphatidylglycerophosphatase A [Xanthomonadales bacterium]
MNAAHPDRQQTSNTRLAFTTLSGFFALGFGSGLAPRAPGTMGSLAALPLAIPLLWLTPIQLGIFLLLAFGFGIYCCEKTSQRMAVQDPGAIVWDEIVAMWLVLAFVPTQWSWWSAAFLLFRLFDIAKPWPIRWLDQHIKGGMGIMLDDVMAAIYSIVLLLVLQRYIPALN